MPPPPWLVSLLHLHPLVPMYINLSKRSWKAGRSPFPGNKIQSTGIPAEEYDCITNYLNSGGQFTDVSTPVIFIKRLMDHETLRAFLPALDKAIEGA